MPSRGRGRGGSRGRGASRGGRRSRARHTDKEGTPIDEHANPEKKELDINTSDVKEYFVGKASIDDHYKAQTSNKARYVAAMACLKKLGVEISSNGKIRALAAAWARKDHLFANSLLKNKEQYGLVEVLKAMTLLDSCRKVRVQEKKLKRLQAQEVNPPKTTTLGKYKRDLDNISAMKPEFGSASGALCKHIKRWVRTSFSEEDLEFYALHLPTESWRQLADICHFNPVKDFPEAPWFLPYCYGEAAPPDSIVGQCKDLNAENVNEMLKVVPIPYSHVKQYANSLTDESKAVLAKDERKIDSVLWNYEDLRCKAVDEVINRRLDSGESINLPTGKFMERLLMLKIYQAETGAKDTEDGSGMNPVAKFYNKLLPTAQKRLESISLPLESPIVVIGDASASMEVAIKTSTIIASILTAVTHAKLTFFDTYDRPAPFIPRNIEEVLQMAVTNKTGGATAPAASLWPFYARKEVVKTFIIVTDEEENTSYKNYRFTQLFKKYYNEVYPAKLVFVSFLYSQSREGQMVGELKRSGFNPIQVKFHQSQPDLTKLDSLFGILSSDSSSFNEELSAMELTFNTQGINETLEKLFI